MKTSVWYTLSDKISADKIAENFAWSRKFCPPKNGVRRKIVSRSWLDPLVMSCYLCKQNQMFTLKKIKLDTVTFKGLVSYKK